MKDAGTVATAIAGLEPSDWILLTLLIIVAAIFGAFLIVAVVRSTRPIFDSARKKLTFGGGSPPLDPISCAYVAGHEKMLIDIKDNVSMVYQLLLPLLGGVKASLEAAKGQVNGNVEKAIEDIDAASRKLNEHLVGKIQ
jgi:hypothetical protein